MACNCHRSVLSTVPYCNQCPRAILTYKIVEVFGSTGTISHFGGGFRGGQYTLVNFLFASRSLCAQPFVKVAARAPCPVVSDPLSGTGAQPLGDGVGKGIWGTEVPQFGRGANPWHGVWCPPFPVICKSVSSCPRALWSRRHYT